MKKNLILMMTGAIMLLIAACDSKKQQAQTDDTDWDSHVEYALRDSTLYGLCTDGSAMNTLQIVTDSGDTLTIGTMQAQEAGMVFGGYSVGDRMAVLTNKNRTQATMVVNESTLMGNWVMPNPMDGTSEMGICIKDGGIAESINQSTIIYKTWRFINGMLEIVSVREDGGDFEETELFHLLYLSADSLAYKDAEETFEYTRPHPEDDYSDLDIEIEEGSFEDFIM